MAADSVIEDVLYGEDFAMFCIQHGVRLAVLFGSRAKGRSGPESDWDLAFWLDTPSLIGAERGRKKRDMVRDLCSLFQTSLVDVVLLNWASPLLKYQVARGGRPVFERSQGSFASFVSLAIRSHSDGWVFRRAERRYLDEEEEDGLTRKCCRENWPE